MKGPSQKLIESGIYGCARRNRYSVKHRRSLRGFGNIKVMDSEGNIKQIISIKDFKKKPKRSKKHPGVKIVSVARESERYSKWRRYVLSRDGAMCVLCNSRIQVEAHHIERWADSVKGRFDKRNGVSLCYVCHHGQRGHRGKEYAVFPQNITSVLRRYIRNLYHRDKPSCAAIVEQTNPIWLNGAKAGNTA